MARARTLPARLGRICLTAVTVAASALVATAGPARAITTPVAGQPCGQDDLGRRAPKVVSASTDRAVTHFSAVNVSSGSNTETEYTLEVTDIVMSEIARNAQVSTKFTLAGIFEIGGNVGYSVKDVSQHTELERTRILWRFTEPGYYGLYKGTNRARGVIDSLQCHRVTQADGTQRLQWVNHAAGTFTTFGFVEQGTVRCEETYPAGTLRYNAQRWLCGFAAVPAAPKAAARAPRENVGTMAVPPEYACETQNYRVQARNGHFLSPTLNTNTLLADSPTNPRYYPWAYWRLCHTSAQYPETVMVNVGTGKCAGVAGASFAEEARIEVQPCDYTPNQRFVIHRDVAGSTKVGLQSVGTGSMWATLGGSQAVAAPVAQYSTGRDDNTGTFSLIPV